MHWLDFGEKGRSSSNNPGGVVRAIVKRPTWPSVGEAVEGHTVDGLEESPPAVDPELTEFLTAGARESMLVRLLERP